MGKKTFGIKVGATKFLHAENQTEQDRLEMMHKGMRLLYIKENATMPLGTDNHRRPAGSDDEVRILRETNRAFDSYVEKNIGHYKKEIHTNLENILQQEDGLEGLETYIEFMEQKYDPDIVASKQQEAEVEMAYQTQQQEDEYDYAMAR